MNLKKKVAMLAAVGIMGLGAIASAANVGVVNMDQLVNNYPGFGALQMQAKQVQDQFEPQIQKQMDTISKMNDKTQQQQAYNQNVVPLIQQGQAALGKIMDPMLGTIQQKVEAVRAQKGLDIIVDNPSSVVAVAQNSPAPVDITNDVAALLK